MRCSCPQRRSCLPLTPVTPRASSRIAFLESRSRLVTAPTGKANGKPELPPVRRDGRPNARRLHSAADPRHGVATRLRARLRAGVSGGVVPLWYAQPPMPSPQAVERVHAIIMLGSFNPAIFHPEWLARRGLIEAEDADRAEVTVVSDDVAAFTLEWVSIEVVKDRFSATATPATPGPEFLRDLVVGIFAALEHTPVRSMGINYMAHFPASSVEEWHALGHRLAPIEPWAEILADPGLLTLQMQGVRTDERDGKINITVQPSAIVTPGVFVAVNDHYDFGDTRDAGLILDVLRDVWDASIDRSYRYAEHVLEVG